MSLVVGALLGATAAVAVDELVLEQEPAAQAQARAEDVVAVPSDLGDEWTLDGTLELSGDADDDAGLLDGCAAEAVAGTASGPGAFSALSDLTGDVITSEVRVQRSAATAASLFQAAVTAEATECVRRSVERDGIERFGAGADVVAVIEPIAAVPGVEQAAGYRIRVDADGTTAQRTDVHILREDRSVAVLQLVDNGQPMALETAVRGIGGVSRRLVDGFGSG